MANIFLFHGAGLKIKFPKWNYGNEGRDFGRCFYTTYDSNTASEWASKNYPDKPVVNCYSIDFERLADGVLNIKRFKANAEWAEFVWHKWQ